MNGLREYKIIFIPNNELEECLLFKTFLQGAEYVEENCLKGELTTITYPKIEPE